MQCCHYVDQVGLGYLVCNVLPVNFDTLMLESSMTTVTFDTIVPAEIETGVELFPVYNSMDIIRYRDIRLRLSSMFPPRAMRRTTFAVYISPVEQPGQRGSLYMNVRVGNAPTSFFSNVDSA